MKEKSSFSESVLGSLIMALGIVVLGLCIKQGIDNVANKDRKVSVKGLSEREVEADEVTWPIVSKEIGNSLPEMYEKIGVKESKIKKFLMSNGIKEDEISVNAPTVLDLNAEQYSSQKTPYRFNITSIITVKSNNVKLVR